MDHCDLGATLRGLARFAATRLTAAFFAIFADFFDVLLAIVFTTRTDEPPAHHRTSAGASATT